MSVEYDWERHERTDSHHDGYGHYTCWIRRSGRQCVIRFDSYGDAKRLLHSPRKRECGELGDHHAAAHYSSQYIEWRLLRIEQHNRTSFRHGVPVVLFLSSVKV